MAGEGVTAMIVAADAGDNPLADRREDREAAAERERKAKVAKVASQSTNAIAAVRAQLDLRKGAADKAANKANDDAGAPVRASSKMVERVFASRLDGPDKAMVARLRQRKTASGAGTGDEIVAGLEKLSESVVQMAGRDGADGITVTAEHKSLLDSVAVEQGRKAIAAKAASNYRQYTSWLSTFATFVTCFYPCGWRHNPPLDGSEGVGTAVDPRLVALFLAMVANRLVPLGRFVCDHVDCSASFAARGRAAVHTKGKEAGERYYGMTFVRTFLDGLSGYSKVWRVMAPQDDPDWYDTIWALRKVCSVRLDSNRPFKAAALCPVTVASLLATLSVTNARDVNIAAVLSLLIALSIPQSVQRSAPMVLHRCLHLPVSPRQLKPLAEYALFTLLRSIYDHRYRLV